MLQAITLNVAINSHNNALLTLLISNNFVEIKGNVFKRLGKDNLHKLAYLDTVERFHIASHLLFVLAQNFRIKEEPWLFDFALNAGKVLLCEVVVDVVKHAFLAKFNEIKPGVYSQFLQSLCRQTVQTHSHQVHKTLMFVPLAPAIVVVRVLSPLFMSMLPKSPLWWKSIVGTTYIGLIFIALLGLKVLLGLGLQIHARWYLNRCLRKEKHLHHE